MNDKNEMSEKLRQDARRRIGNAEQYLGETQSTNDALAEIVADFAAKAVRDREMEIAGELANAIGSAAKGDGGIAIAQLHRKLEAK